MTPKDTSMVDATSRRIDPDVQGSKSGQMHVPRIWTLLNDEPDLYSPHETGRTDHRAGSGPKGAYGRQVG